MGFIKEFKDFAMKGNVVDMAVGVIIGGAFGKIVTSLVDDMMMPMVSVLIGGVNFKDLKIVLSEAIPEQEIAEVSIKYGMFMQNVVDFLIIALCIFVMVKAINSLKKGKEEEPQIPFEPSKEEKLLTEIRDILKNR